MLGQLILQTVGINKTIDILILIQQLNKLNRSVIKYPTFCPCRTISRPGFSILWIHYVVHTIKKKSSGILINVQCSS